MFDTQCSTSQKEHEVEDSIVNCVTEYEEKCEIVTLGITQLKTITIACNIYLNNFKENFLARFIILLLELF